MSSGGSSSAAAQITSKTGSLVSDIDNMKVPELKKRLKSMGLATTGNKAELVERLQEAYLEEKEGSLDGTLDDESLEEALLNDDQDQNSVPETSLLGGEEFSFSSPEKSTQNASTKPLKKRAITHVEEPPVESTPKVSKTLVIKRDNYPIIEAPTIEVTKKDHTPIEFPKSNETGKAVKESSEERLQMRAKRFNIADPKPKVAAVAPIQMSASSNTSNLDLLRKRAERFGENVSVVMKQLENQDRLLKRKMKFVDSSSTQSVSINDKPLSSEQEKKKRRLERFGLTK